jgi:hypothetical protein
MQTRVRPYSLKLDRARVNVGKNSNIQLIAVQAYGILDQTVEVPSIAECCSKIYHSAMDRARPLLRST